jgi:hypothetical protein
VVLLQVRDESANGRYILIIEPFTQIISVSAPGFIQERLRIGTPQAREVRYFRVIPEERRQDLISVIFNVSPTDARLFVDDQQTDINQTVQIQPGQRTVRIEREGYRSLQEQITVSAANILLRYDMEAVILQRVRIKTQPPQTEIVIDNFREGSTDTQGILDLFRFPGSYSLRITADGYLPIQTMIEVRENGDNEFLYSLERNTGILQLGYFPSNAALKVNGRPRTLQSGVIELPPGIHRIEISHPLHDTYEENITIDRGDNVLRNINLVAHTGGLVLTTMPSNAEVRLIRTGGMEPIRWTGSEIQTGLLVGDYRLEVSASGYETKTEQIRITRNEPRSVRVELQPVRPVARGGVIRSDASTIGSTGGIDNQIINESDEISGVMLSLENLRLGNKSYHKNYNGHLYGLSLEMRVNSNKYRDYLSLGLGIFAASTSDRNPINTKAPLMFYFSKVGYGRSYKYLIPEIDLKYGVFQLNTGYVDPIYGEYLWQSFWIGSVSLSVKLPYNFEIRGSYGIYTKPKDKQLLQFSISKRLNLVE